MFSDKKYFVIVILSVLLAKPIYFWLVNKGVGVRFNNHYPGNCRIVPGIQCGSEKISVSKSGLAFITNGLKSPTNCNQEYLKGKLFVFDFNSPGNNVQELKFENLPSRSFLDDFDPHGMDILEDEVDNRIKLFVINHGNVNDSVEVFEYHQEKPDEIQYVTTIEDQKFKCLNDLTLITEDEFYVTNYLKYCRSTFEFLSVFEVFIGFNTGNILHYTQGNTTIAAYGPLLNGLAHSPDYQYIYCATSSAINVYSRTVGGALKLVHQISVTYSPDNIHVDRESGSMYVGLIKDEFGFSALVSNKTSYTSASAVRVDATTNFNDPKDIRITEILHDDGKNFLHAVSSAVFFKGKYLFGTVFHKLGFCTEKKQ